MKTFTIRLIIGFAIGLSAGSAMASTPDTAFFETETFVVAKNHIAKVNKSMVDLGLSEDVDFAWVIKTVKGKSVNFVCYSADCYDWAQQVLPTIGRAPASPEESKGELWRDPSIENKKAPVMTIDEQIKARQLLPYSKVRKG